VLGFDPTSVPAATVYLLDVDAKTSGNDRASDSWSVGPLLTGGAIAIFAFLLAIFWDCSRPPRAPAARPGGAEGRRRGDLFAEHDRSRSQEVAYVQDFL
jgi:hypothetical protein